MFDFFARSAESFPSDFHFLPYARSAGRGMSKEGEERKRERERDMRVIDERKRAT